MTPQTETVRPLRSEVPMPPDLRFRAREDACAVVMVFNGTEHRAVLNLDRSGRCRPEDVARMLERLAAEIRGSRAKG